MGKRYLTLKQNQRIKKIQEKRTKHLQQKRKNSDKSSQLTIEKYSTDQKGLVVVHYGRRIDVESVNETRQRYRCHLRTNLPSLVAGDYVIWHKDNNDTGVVVARCPRRNELCRSDAQGQLRSVAANIDYIIIVVAPVPQFSHLLLDRYLVIAELANIEPIILLNKTDLLTEKNQHELESALSIYQSMGYKIIKTSAYIKEGIDELKEMLSQRISIFMGQSGVGKSSLTNMLLPEAQLKTGELSVKANKGKHTTTFSQLFHLPFGGSLIDSPGINELNLSHIKISQVLDGFREFKSFAGQCKFSNCSHSHEPGCALLAALKEGEISEQRLLSYRAIVNSL